MNCNICPRTCGADRDAGQRGRCGCDNRIVISGAALHLWEEPCISGKNGAGAIFFGGCNLGCVFCQNYEISRKPKGKIYSDTDVIETMKRLEDEGAENIDLVSPTQYSNDLIRILNKYKPSVPVIWNSNAYENVETLKRLEGLVDIYLPDLKFVDSDISLRYAKCSDYFEKASLAIEEMVRQTGECELSKDGMMKKGTMVRHLVLPGKTSQTFKILNYIAKNYPHDVFISLMCQYFPSGEVNEENYPEINRKLYRKEYKLVLEKYASLGLGNGYCQELSSASEKYVPKWDI